MTGTPGSGAAGIYLQRSGELPARALELLAEAPLSTAELAARVLRVAGDAPAAARAVWTLLGDDARFAVSAEGVWSLACPPDASLVALRDERWVVVDVETTGGSPANGHRVTEVAAVCVEGGEVVGSFASLVNPGRPIPSNITALTGISDRMVRNAPAFHEIAPRLGEMLGGRVFVAHNASFDWRFVGSELERASGQVPAGRQLCTVKLARKLLPHLPSRSLGALIEHYGLQSEARHRALDDATATASILIRFIDLLEERKVSGWGGLEEFLGRRTPRRARRPAMPHSMDRA